MPFVRGRKLQPVITNFRTNRWFRCLMSGAWLFHCRGLVTRRLVSFRATLRARYHRYQLRTIFKRSSMPIKRHSYDTRAHFQPESSNYQENAAAKYYTIFETEREFGSTFPRLPHNGFRKASERRPEGSRNFHGHRSGHGRCFTLAGPNNNSSSAAGPLGTTSSPRGRCTSRDIVYPAEARCSRRI